MKYNRIRKSVESVCDSPKLGRTLTINIPQSFCQVFHIAPEITCDVDFVTNGRGADMPPRDALSVC